MKEHQFPNESVYELKSSMYSNKSQRNSEYQISSLQLQPGRHIGITQDKNTDVNKTFSTHDDKFFFV